VLITIALSFKLSSQCDGVLCDNICTNLNVTIEFDEEICFADDVNIPITITGDGVDNSFYTFTLFLDGGVIFAIGASPGFNPSFETTVSFGNNCSPVEYEFSYSIICTFGDENILASGSLGTMTVFPDPARFQPIYEESFECGQPIEIKEFCGTLSLDTELPIYPECGVNSESQIINWTVDPGFDISSIESCYNGFLSGQITIPPCEIDINDSCETLCLGPGTLDEDCICVPNNPIQIDLLEFPNSDMSYCNFDLFPITIDIPNGNTTQGISFLLVNESGSIIGSRTFNNTLSIPSETEILLVLENFCVPILNESIYFIAACPTTSTPLIDPIPLGEISVYPDLELFQLTEISGGSCNTLPEFETFCGDVIINEIIAVNSDCNAPTIGEYEVFVDPGFNTDEAPSCFQLPMENIFVPPCLSDCPCNNTMICNGVPIGEVDVFIVAPEFICGGVSSTANVVISGVGVESADLKFWIFCEGNPLADIDISAGESNSFDISLSSNNFSCEPILKNFSYVLSCGLNSFIAEGSINPVTIYPNPELYSPRTNNGTECGYPEIIEPPFCGELILDPPNIPNPNCGLNATVQTVNWEVVPGLAFPPEISDCYLFSLLQGEIRVEPCSLQIGDTCESDCLGQGIVDNDCNCIFSNPPQLSIPNLINGSFCSGDLIEIGFQINGFRPNLTVRLEDQFGNSLGFPSSNDVVFYIPNNPSCEIIQRDLFLNLMCSEGIESYEGPKIFAGSISIYPSTSRYNVFEFYSQRCGEGVLWIESCADLKLIDSLDPINGESDGFVEYELCHSFDIDQAPPCFTPPETVIFPIEACESCGSHGTLIINAIPTNNGND